MKKFFILLFFSLSFLFLKNPVFSAEEFITSYDVTYEAYETGVLKVTQNISLTNKLSNIYATKYSLILEGKPVENIKAFDDEGELKTTTIEEENKLIISLEFNKKVVGKGEKLDFTVSYESSELLQKTGQIWEVTIPKLAKPEEIDEYKLKLVVPKSFGQPAFISPQPFSSSQEGNNQIYYFNKNQLVSSGIVSSFGQLQTFDFNLIYHLENKKLYPVETYISLPPDTNYQKVSYYQISPQPENVTVDNDGNWLAKYLLSPSEKLDINAVGQVQISTWKRASFYNKNKNLSKYLEPQEFWEQNEEIKRLGRELATPERIFQYVVDNLEYDYSRVREGAKRLGASEVLKNKNRAICTEYTDLFIALSRADSIPARELNGYAYTTNPVLQPLSLVQDVLHSWPEYWDSQKQAWIQIDPTWQDTTGGVDFFRKLDLGHFTFVIHGETSSQPPPAGSYKLPGVLSKDVIVSFGQFKEGKENFTVQESLPKQISAERKAEGSFLVVNTGTDAIYNLPLTLASQNLTFLKEPPKEIPVLPPFSKVEIPLSFKAKSFSLKSKARLSLFAGSQVFENNIKIESIIASLVLPILGIFLCLLALHFVKNENFLKIHQDFKY